MKGEKKFIGVKCLLLLLILPTQPLWADDRHDSERGSDPASTALCGDPDPILSLPDFNGSGVVDNADVVLIKSALKKDLYVAFYDINADGYLNYGDLYKTWRAIGKTSTALDRQKAYIFHQVKQFQLVDSREELNAMLVDRATSALAGHGEHWQNEIGYLTVIGEAQPYPLRAEGLNVSADGKSVKGMFWGKAAVPVFENGATDYPTPGGAWTNSRVIAFADMPPKFTASEHERWHTHAGLCVTADAASNPEGFKIVLNQHTTFAECQAIPSVWNTPEDPINTWLNIWMLHAWMFDLNPNGFFAGTHPCVDPDAPSEDTINGGREVPEFFQHHGSHQM